MLLVRARVKEAGPTFCLGGSPISLATVQSDAEANPDTWPANSEG